MSERFRSRQPWATLPRSAKVWQVIFALVGILFLGIVYLWITNPDAPSHETILQHDGAWTREVTVWDDGRPPVLGERWRIVHRGDGAMFKIWADGRPPEYLCCGGDPVIDDIMRDAFP